MSDILKISILLAVSYAVIFTIVFAIWVWWVNQRETNQDDTERMAAYDRAYSLICSDTHDYDVIEIIGEEYQDLEVEEIYSIVASARVDYMERNIPLENK